MNIYWCNPEKGRQYCTKPARFCGKYCTMTYNKLYTEGGPPLDQETVDRENERIRKLYEEERQRKRKMAAGGNGNG